MGGKRSRQLAQHRQVPVGVDATHATDVAAEVALLDERGGGVLQRHGGVPVGDVLGLVQRRVQRWGAITKPSRSVGSSTFENEPT